MKLIDILVEELPKCGGWDAKWHQCAQDGNGEVCFFTSGEIHFRGIFDAWSIPPDSVSRHDGKARLEVLLADDYSETIITREQYEAALAAKNEGWTEWGGGECPVNTAAMVDVVFRYKNHVATNSADFWRWDHNGTDSDIIAYRLHQPQEAEQVKADDEVDLNECIGQDAAPVWNGEGQPPVGVECECSWCGDEWQPCKILFASNQIVVVKLKESGMDDAYNIGDVTFRPIRSEADRKRDEAVQELCNAGGGSGRVDEKSGYGSCWFDIYDAIAAGKIPGVRLDN